MTNHFLVNLFSAKEQHGPPFFCIVYDFVITRIKDATLHNAAQYNVNIEVKCLGRRQEDGVYVRQMYAKCTDTK